MSENNGKNEVVNILLGLAALIVLLLVIAFAVSGTPADTAIALNKLKVAVGFTLLAIIFLFGFAILIAMAKGAIDLSDLLSETGDNKASMSRFQLLIFTLVISLSLFLVVVAKSDFPAIPPEVLTLLGISATTYAVSKGIQVSGNQSSKVTQQPDGTRIRETTSGTNPNG
jgi:amino acid transporter